MFLEKYSQMRVLSGWFVSAPAVPCHPVMTSPFMQQAGFLHSVPQDDNAQRLISCLDFQKASPFTNRKGLFAKTTQTNVGEAVIRDSKASRQSQVQVLQTEGRKERRSRVKRRNLPPAPGPGLKRMESVTEAPCSASQTSVIYTSTLRLFAVTFHLW